MSSSFLNADGTINAGKMVEEAQASGGSSLPDGTYICRLLSAEIVDARGPNKQPLPGKKKLMAKFTIQKGEYEKQELFLSYNLFLNPKKDGSGPGVGSSSGTVRFITDLAAIGKPYVDGNGSKLALDKNGNMGLVTSKGILVEALKKLWMERVAGATISIEAKTETSERPGGNKFSFQIRKFIGIYTSTNGDVPEGRADEVAAEYDPDALDESAPF